MAGLPLGRVSLPTLVIGPLILGGVAPSNGFGLDPSKDLIQYVRDTWRAASGLPQDTVRAIAQTREGYLWLGTEEGLARFDGVRFVVFDRNNSPGLPGSNVEVLLVARDGRLWIGTYGTGLAVRDKGRFTAFGEKEGVPGNSVLAAAEDPRGVLWVGTNAGLVRFENGRFERVAEAVSLGPIKSLLATREGTVWVGSDVGLMRIAAGTSRTYGVADGLPGTSITALAQDKAGTVWVGTAQGLARLDGDRFVASPVAGIQDPFIAALRGDREGSLWIGTNEGLLRRSGGRLEHLGMRDGLPNNAIQTLFEDQNGSLWAGIRGGGLTRFKEGDFLTYGPREGLPHPILDAVLGVQTGDLLLGGYGGYVTRITPEGRLAPLRSWEPQRASNIRAFHVDRSGDLWIGAWLGLFRYRAGSVQTRATSGLTNVRVIREDKTGSLWVGTDGNGLYRWQGSSVRHFTTADGLPSEQIRAVVEDRSGVLWIGTYGGLARLGTDGRFTALTTLDGLPSNLVRALREDAAGDLWIGTYGGGLARLREGHLTSWTGQDGIPSDVIYEILEDARGYLWMSSNRGIFRVSKKDLEDRAAGRVPRVRSVMYTESDGLGSRECNGGNPSGWKTPDGRLCFVTVGGAVVVDPTHLKVDAPPPAVVVEDVVIDGRAVDTSRRARLPPGRHSLEFHYTALGSPDPRRVRFRYRLDGFDGDWTDVGERRTAYYTGLPAGHYGFLVTASADGERWQDAARFSFDLEPHFYERPTFYSLAGLGAVLLGVALQQARVRRARARARELKREVDRALAQVKTLSGLVPICAWCKKVRDDRGYWNQIEAFLRDHSEADFTHGICPECLESAMDRKHNEGRTP